MKENNFNQVFLNTLDSLTSSGISPALKGLQVQISDLSEDLHPEGSALEQLFSFLHLNNVSANISEKSLSILLSKASFAFLLISMLFYWFQMSFKSQIVINKLTPQSPTADPEGVREAQGYSVTPEKSSDKSSICTYKGRAQYGVSSVTGKKSTLAIILEKIPFISMWSANITLVLLLSIRWIESGHFPLSNLYESLIFLSWSLTVIHLFLENLFHKNSPNRLGPKHILLAEGDGATHAPSLLGIPLSEDLYPEGYASDPTLTLGAITSPVALFTNAFATFSLPEEMQKVTVLVPALKSNWLIMHVSVMIISYAALLSGSLLAMAFLVIKFIDELRINKHSLPRRGSGEVPEAFQRHSLQIKDLSGMVLTNGVVQIKDLSELWQRIVLTNKEALNPLQVANPHTSFSSELRLENLSEDLSGIVLTTKSKAEESQPLLLTQRLTNQRSDVNLEGTLFGTIAGLPPTRLLTENKMLMNLPQILDNLSYRSIGLGFALLTIGILSGAVWANEAWGSYWSWDPKETWALITWLVFALYLHTRLSKGWVGKESAFVASFGFIVIWFCYLGVNLFGKGLHSYGWFQQ